MKNGKRLLSVALALCMVLALWPAGVLAANVVDSGTCGDNLMWTLDSDGVLTISGTGKMAYHSSHAPWYNNIDSIKSVKITDGVTSICSWAFEKCENITSVSIPNSVTSIESFAFYWCRKLISVEIPSSVTLIDWATFEGCSSLTNVTIPNSVTSIGDEAFYSCSSLTNVTIPNNVSSIGYDAFWSCSSLTDITIPSSVTSIGDGAFSQCDGLTCVTISDGVTSIGERAFAHCYRLKSVTIPHTVSSIGQYAFSDDYSLNYVTFEGNPPLIAENSFNNVYVTASYPTNNSAWTTDNMQNYGGSITWEPSDSKFFNSNYCGENLTWTLDENGLLTITGTGKMYDYKLEATPWFDYDYEIRRILLEPGITYIGEYAFWIADVNDLVEVTIPSTVTAIGANAFAMNYALESISIPESVETIGVGAFSGCDLLSDVSIPSSVTTIESHAFYFTGITSITIPSSVTTIGSHAFGECTKLKTITVEDGNPNYCSSDGIVFNKSRTKIVAVPAGRENTSYTIPIGVSAIGDGAFMGCRNLKSVTIPDTVTGIEPEAFYNCHNLESITIGTSVASIVTAD